MCPRCGAAAPCVQSLRRYHPNPNQVRGGYPVDPLPRAELLALFGHASWTPQLLLPGNATPLGPYLARAAAGLLCTG